MISLYERCTYLVYEAAIKSRLNLFDIVMGLLAGGNTGLLEPKHHFNQRAHSIFDRSTSIASASLNLTEVH